MPEGSVLQLTDPAETPAPGRGPAASTAVSTAASPGAGSAPLEAAVAAPRGGGRVVLRVPPDAPHRMRVARAVLQEGALAAGGTVVDGPAGDLLLVGAEEGRATRLRALVDRLLGGPVTGLWSLDRDLAVLRRYAAGQALSAPAPNVAGPPLAELDAWLAALPLTRLLRRRAGLLRSEGVEGATPTPGFLRLEIARDRLSTMLGALGQDRDLVEHARRVIGQRLLQALGQRAMVAELLGDRPAPHIHLPVPASLITGRSGGSGGGVVLVATVALEAAADPAALARRRAALASLGWLLEVDGLDALALSLIDPRGLPADLLRLHWSAALPACQPVLAGIDPEALILSGVGDAAALDWAARMGIRRLEGPPDEDATPECARDFHKDSPKDSPRDAPA